MTLIADSGALYVLNDADDRHHQAVREAFERARGTIVVPALLLSEVDYLQREFLGIDAELDFLTGLEEGAYLLEPPIAGDVARIRGLIEQ